MKRFSEQLHTKAKSVTLKAAEQRELRERIISYMEYHPFEQSVSRPAKNPRTLTIPGYQVVRIPFSTMLKWSGMTAMFLLITIPVLAEKSVPGDSLYAVKVQFTEELRSSLTLTPYGRVEWETERLNRRIAEAKLLVNEGKLTDEVEAEIAAAVKEHSDIVRGEIEALREDDADQAALAVIELSTTLELQSTSLQEEGSAMLASAVYDAATANPAQMVVDALNESLSSQASQVDAATIPAYDKTMARVEINTTRAYELLESLALAPDDQLRREIGRRLEDAARSIEQSKSLRAENEVLAGEQLVDVLQRTQKLIVYMSDIGANSSIALETIVPILLTPEEQREKLIALTLEVNKKREILKVYTPKLSVQTADKVAFSLSIAAANEKAIASSTDMKQSLALVTESEEVLKDAVKLAEAEGVVITAATPQLELATTTTEQVADEDVLISEEREGE